MPAPTSSLLELGPDDLVAEPEERSTSQTRRMGSNAQAAFELEISKSQAAPVVNVELDDAEPIEPEAPTGPGPGPEAGGAAHAATPISKPYLAGDVIAGKYKLTRIIGKGGMGAVWRAHNNPLDIDVAIKLIRRDRTAPGAPERLLTEARAAARLMHPSIVRVFDFGESEQGDPFIVMELLHGESLSAILRRKKRLSPAVAVQTMLPVAGALASAHGKGIVHRDLKPDNIIIISHENGALLPKIVDFGIAKLLDIERSVTMAGEVLGSPDYMSPEQARGADNVGEATDVWAFSVVLYELLTGVRPFDGQNYNALIAAILTNEPEPITARGVPDGELAAVIGRGLAKDVGDRWHKMKDLGAALAQWAVSRGIEDDVAGNPIGKQWLGGAVRRVLTVQPELDATVALPLEGMAPAAAAQPTAPAPPSPRPAMDTVVQRPRAAPRLWWMAPVIAALALVATAGYLARDRLRAKAAEGADVTTAIPAPTVAPSPAPTDTAAAPPPAPPVASSAPATSAASAPSGDLPAPSAQPTAAPTASARPPAWKPKPRAPRVPKNIRF